MTAVETGPFARVPLLIGSTHDEARGWAQPFAKATPAQYEKSLEYLFGNRAMLLRPGGSSAVTSAALAATRHCALWNSFGYPWLDVDPDQLAQQLGVGRP